MALLKDMIQGGMQKLAGEAAAAATAETLGRATEMTTKDEKIVQLESRIYELQVPSTLRVLM